MEGINLKIIIRGVENIKLTAKNLDHLGIVNRIFEQLGILEVIDEKMPKNKKYKVAHSTIVKAIIINGLGFVERRLYLFPSYFVTLSTERLLEEIFLEDINKDTVGRILDRIYEYETTKLFTEIVINIMNKRTIDRVTADTFRHNLLYLRLKISTNLFGLESRKQAPILAWIFYSNMYCFHVSLILILIKYFIKIIGKRRELKVVQGNFKNWD